MDFKSLINKINSLNDEVKTVAAPTIAPAVQLNEDAQLRVLSGRTTYVAEAKKKAEEAKKEKEVEEGFDADSKTGDTFKTAKGTATKTSTGMKHTRDKYDYDPGSDDKDDKKRKETARKAKKESVDADVFKGKFAKMVEAKKDEKKDPKKKPMKEAAKPDFLDIDGDGDKKEPMKKAAGEKGGEKKDGKKGMSDKQAKYFGKKNESVSSDVKKASKKLVKESAEPKLSFKQMVQLVQESGGQQQIDPTDKELFNWATRVASSKLGEGMKAELYAGLIYERNGGVFEMYDVLSEDQK
jgi:hypothetical protein